MKTTRLTTLVGAAVVVLGQPQANACGDKLSMMGGGVSFEMLNPSLHQGARRDVHHARIVVARGQCRLEEDARAGRTQSALGRQCCRASNPHCNRATSTSY